MCAKRFLPSYLYVEIPFCLDHNIRTDPIFFKTHMLFLILHKPSKHTPLYYGHDSLRRWRRWAWRFSIFL